MTPPVPASVDFQKLKTQIRCWSGELGFDGIGISDTELSAAERYLFSWLKGGRHGEMSYLARHGTRRSRPAELVPETIRVISVRMNYWCDTASSATAILSNPEAAYISRYALGRDYHKIMRRKLQQLADRITSEVGEFQFRAFADSAPVMEKPLGVKSGLGWMGKHTNLIDRDTGSWFFLGELYTDLPLPFDTPQNDNCGSCTRCITACPTNAITAPYELDARLCISYLTIEHKGAIPIPLRALIGNRIFGCDDCQLVCPWNRDAAQTTHKDFVPRHGLDASTLIELFQWTEIEFDRKTAGSAIRRAGYECWLRNLAIALGNAPTSKPVTDALLARRTHPSELVREHTIWALQRHNAHRSDTS
jgi:epoxyqueuosine reductase